ncbi:triose-phosphate isomerase [Aestuariibacter sp. AA17]|uniref:Triosephosphate isomerase n=2 Tax=Fluctibacter corallii TaxID=2984329 RepID=A0ABT3A6S1_9ALTE|nr:triose-phosphate isomerase [Aestuariibacter sp. AA17]MCV2883987.1 triose-phosphate isomerase [Aestuariibacter sp. AA17]
MNTLRRPVVAGNWKMNGNKALASEMSQAFDNQHFNNVEVIVCPPFPLLTQLSKESVKVGAQNISKFDSGAHTGEVSADILKDAGCEYVIVGHSERRVDNFESNGLVADKVDIALKNGLHPILCIGEPEDVRDAGDLFDFLSAQLNAVVSKVGIDAFAQLTIAYEPIWAIGTGKTASPEQAQEVHGFIRDFLATRNKEVAQKIRILYGGSVKADNATELFSQPDVDGGLIGGASLDPQSFISICRSAAEIA